MAKTTVLVREYNDGSDFQKDARKLAKDGWAVTNSVSQEQKKGCIKAFLSPFTRRKSHVIVTYNRP